MEAPPAAGGAQGLVSVLEVVVRRDDEHGHDDAPGPGRRCHSTLPLAVTLHCHVGCHSETLSLAVHHSGLPFLLRGLRGDLAGIVAVLPEWWCRPRPDAPRRQQCVVDLGFGRMVAAETKPDPLRGSGITHVGAIGTALEKD
jgi:hypothetical protein